MLMSLLANRRIPGEHANRSETGSQEDGQSIMAGTSIEEVSHLSCSAEKISY